MPNHQGLNAIIAEWEERWIADNDPTACLLELLSRLTIFRDLVQEKRDGFAGQLARLLESPTGRYVAATDVSEGWVNALGWVLGEGEQETANG